MKKVGQAILSPVDWKHDRRRDLLSDLVKASVLLLALGFAALSHETLTTTVLFDREIVRILDKHCVMCHVQDGPAFPLETYEQTWLQKRPIRAEVIARHMPPWAAVPGYGQFANDNSLTLRETQFIVSWVEGLGPRNSGTVFTNTATVDNKRPTEVRAHTDFGYWTVGQPDVKIPVSGSTADIGLKSETFLRGFEFIPSDRRTLHAVSFKVQETGQWIGSWTPWYGFMSLPQGTAYRIPAGAHIIADKPLAGTLGLYLTNQRSPAVVSDLVLTAGTPVRLPSETQILAINPDIPAGTKSLEVSARKPDGGTEVLLYAKDISIQWPTPYILKSPVRLPRGTQISVIGHGSEPIRVIISTANARP